MSLKRVKELLPDSPPYFDKGPVDGQAGAFLRDRNNP